MATSRSMRASSSARGPLVFSATRASAASRPKPACTQVVTRSSASGSDLSTSFWRLRTRPLSHVPGSTQPTTPNIKTSTACSMPTVPHTNSTENSIKPAMRPTLSIQNTA